MKRLFLLLLFLPSCIRVCTDPTPAFNEVAQEVCRRSGYLATWEENYCIDDILQEKLTLQAAIQLALLNNKQLQASFHTLGIGQAELAQAGLLTNPLFAFSYRLSTLSSITTLIDTAIFHNLLEMLLIPLKKRAAAAELAAIKREVAADILTLLAEVKKSYFAVQAKEQRWPYQEKLLLSAKSSYQAAEKLYANGNITQVALLAKQNEYEYENVALAKLEVEILNAREMLTTLLGLSGNQIEWQLASTLLPEPEERLAIGDVESQAIACSLDLAKAKCQMVATAASYGINTTKLIFPQIDVGVSAEREDSVWFVGPAFSLPIPLFDFGKASSAAARSELLRQWNEYCALAVMIQSKARTAKFDLAYATHIYNYSKNVLVPSAEKMTSQMLLQHNAMQVGLFMLLETKSKEIREKIGKIEALATYWMHRTNLELILAGHMYE